MKREKRDLWHLTHHIFLFLIKHAFYIWVPFSFVNHLCCSCWSSDLPPSLVFLTHRQVMITFVQVNHRLHEFACHPSAKGHANLLFVVTILVYVQPKSHLSKIKNMIFSSHLTLCAILYFILFISAQIKRFPCAPVLTLASLLERRPN